MPNTETWTVGRLLQWTADFLGKHDADSPRLESELLLAHAMGVARISLYTTFDDQPNEAVRARFRDLVRRRADGTPVAYLLGHKEFYSLDFAVSPAVLIPRPETEHLVVRMIDLGREAVARSQRMRIVDVGTGSGIIAICAAKHLAECDVTAVDISAAALDVARKNAEAHGVSERIRWLEGDLLAPVDPDEPVDLVCSNPPYVSEPEYAELPRDVREFEPRDALVAGPSGTEVIDRLAAEAATRLTPGGRMLVEISPMIHEAVESLLRTAGCWDVRPVIKDAARRPRIVVAVLA